MRRGRRVATRGFTMVEMIVAIGIFTTLMLMITGSFLSITEAARKARATRVALDNVSGTLDYMAREIRLGIYFHCENDVGAPSIAIGVITTPQSCAYANGGNILAFERAGGSLSTDADQLVFWHAVDGNGVGHLWRSTQSGANPEMLTAAELDVTGFRFYVDRTAYSVAGSPADQPRITIVIRGVAGGNKVRTQVSFTLQTTLSARTPNIPSTP